MTRNRRLMVRFGLLFVMFATLLPGCVAPAAAPNAAATAPVSGAASPGRAEDSQLKISLIPVLDVIPFLIAQQNGYYKDQGLQVELIPVKSPQERDTLLQTAQTDGTLTDLIATGLFNKDTAKTKVVYTSRRSYPDAPVFRILAAPNTPYKTPADLKGVPVGISQNTVIQYLTDRILQAEGVPAQDQQIVEVTAIPVRFEQLMNGNLKAATLPDPLASGAQAGGARLIADDTRYPQYSQSVITFRVEALQQKPNTIKKFLMAWKRAVDDLKAHPEKYQNLLIEQGRVPKSIEGTYKMPPFPQPGLPSQTEIADVVQWMRAKGLVSRDIPYGDMVDATFLPK